MVSSYTIKKAEKVRMLLAGLKLGTSLEYDNEGRLTLKVAKKGAAETFKDKVLHFVFVIPKGFFDNATGEQYKIILDTLNIKSKTKNNDTTRQG